MKKVSPKYIIAAIVVSVILYRVISRKQEEEPIIPSLGDLSPSPTTPVSGTSQTILDNINENDAHQLKEELKK